MAKRSAKPRTKGAALSAAQHQQLREKLGAIMQSIQSGQIEHAAGSLMPLLRKHPAVHEVCHVASALSIARREFDRAAYYADRAVELAPDIAEYHAAVGSLHLRRGHNEQAVAPLEQALKRAPNMPRALVALGTARMQLGDIDEARACFNQALAMDPADREAANNLALLQSDTAHAHDAVEITERALQHLPADPLLLDALCMFSCYDDRLTPDEVFDIHRRFGQSVQSRVRTPARYPNTPDPDRRIRVGFVSPDLRTHSIAYFIQPIIEHLDRRRFEVCCYHTSRHGDEMSDGLRASCDLWRTCAEGLNQAHKRVIDDRVDILIELNGHFAGNLLPLFAVRPTPVSVSMIGYANTTGLPSIDARIVDDITDPAPQADAWASESLIRLPGCFLCYRPPGDAPDPRDPDPDRPYTFGSFNDLRKLSASNLETWAAILRDCPDAVLLLKSGRLAHEPVRNELHQRFASCGIDPARVELMGRTDTVHEHLDLYNRIDCALDTFPYTGTTTTCEAMHMGVATITLLGASHAGRVSASLLHAAGCPEDICEDRDAYTERAKRAYGEGKRTRVQRDDLRARLGSSVLCDERGYAHAVAEAFSALWTGWCTKNGGV